MANAGKKAFARARQDLQMALKLKPDHPKADFMKQKIAQWSNAKPLPQAKAPAPVATPDWMSGLSQGAPQPQPQVSNSLLSVISQGSAPRQTGTMRTPVPPKLAPVSEPASGLQGNILMGIVGGLVGALLGAFI